MILICIHVVGQEERAYGKGSLVSELGTRL
jgi:hypothetical protein